MNILIDRIAECVENGKVNQSSPYPPQMKGQPGADELTRQALDEGTSPGDVLNKALVPAMNRVGQKYTENKIFVPQMLLAARAMSAAMAHIKPFFQTGEVKRKGVMIIGTVMGDLHDIGKNLCCMMDDIVSSTADDWMLAPALKLGSEKYKSFLHLEQYG